MIVSTRECQDRWQTTDFCSSSEFWPRTPQDSCGRLKGSCWPETDVCFSLSRRSHSRHNKDTGEHFCRGRWLCRLTVSLVLQHSWSDPSQLGATGPASGGLQCWAGVACCFSLQRAGGARPQARPHLPGADSEWYWGVLLHLLHLSWWDLQGENIPEGPGKLRYVPWSREVVSHFLPHRKHHPETF